MTLSPHRASFPPGGQERLFVMSCGYEKGQIYDAEGNKKLDYDLDRRAVDCALLAAQEGRELAWWPMWREVEPGDLLLFRLAEHEALPIDEEIQVRAASFANGRGPSIPTHPDMATLGGLALEPAGFQGIAVIAGRKRGWLEPDGGLLVSGHVTSSVLFPEAIEAAVFAELLDHSLEVVDDAMALPASATSVARGAVVSDRRLGDDAAMEVLEALSSGALFPRTTAGRQTAASIRELRALAQALRLGASAGDVRSLAPSRTWVEGAPRPLAATPGSGMVAVRLDVERERARIEELGGVDENSGWHHSHAFERRVSDALGVLGGAEERAVDAAIMVAVTGWTASELCSSVGDLPLFSDGYVLRELELGIGPGVGLPAVVAHGSLIEPRPTVVFVVVDTIELVSERESAVVSEVALDDAQVETAWRLLRRWWQETTGVKRELSDIVGRDVGEVLAEARGERAPFVTWFNARDGIEIDTTGEAKMKDLLGADAKLAGLPSSLEDAGLPAWRALPGRLGIISGRAWEGSVPAAQGGEPRPGWTCVADAWLAEVVSTRALLRDSADSAARLAAASSAAKTRALLSKSEDAKRAVTVAAVMTLFLAAVGILATAAGLPHANELKPGDLMEVAAGTIVALTLIVAVAYGLALLTHRRAPESAATQKSLKAAVAVGFVVAVVAGGLRLAVSTSDLWLVGSFVGLLGALGAAACVASAEEESG